MLIVAAVFISMFFQRMFTHALYHAHTLKRTNTHTDAHKYTKGATVGSNHCQATACNMKRTVVFGFFLFSFFLFAFFHMNTDALCVPTSRLTEIEHERERERERHYGTQIYTYQCIMAVFTLRSYTRVYMVIFKHDSFKLKRDHSGETSPDEVTVKI